MEAALPYLIMIAPALALSFGTMGGPDGGLSA